MIFIENELFRRPSRISREVCIRYSRLIAYNNIIIARHSVVIVIFCVIDGKLLNIFRRSTGGRPVYIFNGFRTSTAICICDPLRGHAYNIHTVPKYVVYYLRVRYYIPTVIITIISCSRIVPDGIISLNICGISYAADNVVCTLQ